MKPIDTHAHLQFEAYNTDRQEVVKRNSRDLEALINVGTSLEASKQGIELSNKVTNFYASIGVHPHHVKQWDDSTYRQLKELAVNNPKVVAVGEIGLDNHLYQGYPQPNLKEQAEILDEQINLALELKKPILFHCRQAYGELHNQIKIYKGQITGLMHCYMGDWEEAKKFLDLGLYLSFAGNITYKGNDYLRDVAKKAPADRLLTETDSPFLTPEPHRGERNEPIYVTMVIKEIATQRLWSLQETTTITTNNAKRLLNIGS